ncbi:MAG: GntR family transcriptional regulator [Pseudomonadales bacterium]
MANAADRAYQTIRAAILDRTFPPDARLKEAELVAFCGVSRTPVREALRRLAAEDFVRIQRNQGAEVKSWSSDDLDDLFSLRALLEGHAAGRAAQRIRQSDLARIASAIADMDAVLAGRAPQADKIAEFLRLNRVVHEAVWRASGSERLVSMLGRLVEQALMAHTAQQFSLARVAQSHHHHQELLRALEARDDAWAEAIMRSHIRAARQALEPPAGPHGGPHGGRAE